MSKRGRRLHQSMNSRVKALVQICASRGVVFNRRFLKYKVSVKLSKKLFGIGSPVVKNHQIKLRDYSKYYFHPHQAMLDKLFLERHPTFSIYSSEHRQFMLDMRDKEKSKFVYVVKKSVFSKVTGIYTFEEAKTLLNGAEPLADKLAPYCLNNDDYYIGVPVQGCTKCNSRGWRHAHIYNEEQGRYILDCITCECEQVGIDYIQKPSYPIGFLKHPFNYHIFKECNPPLMR